MARNLTDQIGRVLGGRYRLAAPIGTGASAHVYVADDVTLRRRVAVKVLHPALAEDESFLRRFRAEAQQAAQLRHPNVMQVFDWGQDDDGPYLVLELLDGGSLRDMLDRGVRLSPSQALLVGLEAARGLEYAHRRGLVHRDIKPANLLFDDEGRLAIADFGLARALAEAAWTEPSGAVLGTARYASPEQAKGLSVDGRADVYALALTLVEAVTGSVPFTADTTIATLMARIDRELEVPDELGALGPVLVAAAAPDVDERLDSGELVRRLERAARDLPPPAALPVLSPDATVDLTAVPDDLTLMPPPASTRLFDVAAHDLDGAEPPGVEVVDEAGRGGRARRRLGIALLVVLLLAGVAGAALTLSSALKPEHAVPELQGMALAAAQAEVRDEKFTVRVVGREFHEEVPEGVVLSQSPLSGEKLREGEAVKVKVSKGPAPREVPDLTGLTTIEAEQALVGAGLTFKGVDAYSAEVEAGRVIDWAPKDGLQPKGAEITVTISKGPEPKPVPSFLDRVYEQYEKLLRDLGFDVTREEAFSEKVDQGQIITTRPAPGEELPPGSQVVIVVSKGPELVQVPNLKGLTEQEAEQRLASAGLRLGDRFGPRDRKVFDSNPPAGTAVRKGSTVDIYTR